MIEGPYSSLGGTLYRIRWGTLCRIRWEALRAEFAGEALRAESLMSLLHSQAAYQSYLRPSSRAR